MFRVPLLTASEEITPEQYWSSIFLYHNSPHLVNRKLLGIKQLFYLKISFNNESYKLKDVLSYEELESQIRRFVPFSSNISKDIVLNIIELNTNNSVVENVDFNNILSAEDGNYVSVRLLLPRNSKAPKGVEVVIIDKGNNTVSFSAISELKDVNICPNFSYDVELENKFLKVCVNDIEFAETKSSDWLVDNLFLKLLSWAKHSSEEKVQQKSLSLINVEEYCTLYHDLKIKYGDKMVKIWPENTDPKKFVFEDIAIASYLLLLWKQTSDKKQTYVDLGCGNGLLVYILNEEGHKGYGIDIRSRKIWNFYPQTTVLKVSTIVPSSTTIFPEADWLIGNHSDELTPWLPVMSARSSNNCNFFLLPCCSYEFDGSKYQRKDSSKSVYNEYLEYVQNIVETCGFQCEIDKLRIPSTKRICLVGRTRVNNNFEDVNRNITELINSRCNKVNKDWVDDYKTRKEETVRNCTKLDKNLVNNIVKKVVDQLLLTKNYIGTSKSWNSGGRISLPDLVKLITAEELKHLKNECGGLQTLLKNHRFVFKVEKGFVQLRVPNTNYNSNLETVKKRECWFFNNHPDGCFVDEANCSYLHRKL